MKNYLLRILGILDSGETVSMLRANEDDPVWGTGLAIVGSLKDGRGFRLELSVTKGASDDDRD